MLLMLVDSGSSTIFISKQMVEKLRLEVEECDLVKIKVASGDIMVSTRRVREVKWWTGGHTFVFPMRVLDIGVYDSILGFDWLRAHSPMNCDWDKKTLEFYYQGQWVQIQGNCAKVTKIPQVHAVQVQKWLKGNDVWAFVLLEQVVQRKEKVKEQLAALLTEFQDLFSQHTTLPPKRVFDHYIPLLPGSVPVNARPYRYSPLHKDEIERQVAELLKAGLIVPSVSSFASPVLLVQKKDGT
jgi:hypothetical protein